MKFFDIIKTIYQKNKVNIEVDTTLCMTLNKWLSFDKDNINIIKNKLNYLFYIEPKHYFYLLFFSIPRKTKIPFFNKIEKDIEKEDKLLNKVKHILNWSEVEIEKNKKILKETIIKNSDYWKKELGVK